MFISQTVMMLYVGLKSNGNIRKNPNIQTLKKPPTEVHQECSLHCVALRSSSQWAQHLRRRRRWAEDVEVLFRPQGMCVRCQPPLAKI